jgi:hypothetical protein
LLLALLALGLAACGPRAVRGKPAPAPAPAATAGTSEPAIPPAEAGDDAGAEVSPAPKEPPAPKQPTTPMCKSYKQVVDAASDKFAGLAEGTALPGAASCKVVGGGPGHSATSTFTCEFGTADDPAALASKRDQLAEQIRDCGASDAMAATRIRVVSAGGANTLVVNVHDFARWR